jgi:hypothetical protein
MAISYAWTVEVLEDEYNDIEENDFRDTYAEALKAAEAMKKDLKPGRHIEIGLVRDQGDEVDGIQDRQWAYVGWKEDGKLPARFDGGAAVPKRFHKEVG